MLTAFPQIPNAGFENWSSSGFPSHLDPDDWGTLNGATAITGTVTCERGSGADAHSGSYSIKLTSKSVFGRSAPGIAVTGTINTSTQELEGGFTITQRPSALTGWYKFSPVAGDSGEIRVNLWRWNGGVREDVGEGVLNPTTAVPSFMQFIVPIAYTSASAPDSGRILLVSTNTNNIQVGSQLIVDDLAFVDCSTFSASVTTVDATTPGGSDGTATAVPSGGIAPYTYNWGTGATTGIIMNLPQGVYCVTVTDALGCAAFACGTVSEPGCTTLTVTVTGTDVTTVGGSDGSATATVSGGNPAYTYQWNDPNSSTTDSLLNLPAGTYCVTVTDAASCQTFGCVTVNEPDCSGFSVSVSGTNPSSVGNNDGTATANVSGGAPNYSYLWSPGGQTVATLDGLPAGVYCVTVTDAVGCTAAACDTLSDPSCSGFSVSVAATDETAAGANDGTASATPAGGASPVTYVWSNTSTGQNLANLPPGLYCVTATDANGCDASACDSVGAGPVGINNLVAEGIRLFPNPANDAVIIEKESEADYGFRLFDVRGNLVVGKNITAKKTSIPLAGLPAGNYLFELNKVSDGKIFTGKLLKE